MNARLFLSIVVIVLLFGSTSGVAARSGAAVPAAPEAQAGTAFTYQGQIDSGGSPINSSCDFQFTLYDAATSGTQIGTMQTSTGVNVTNGLFIVSLDFGSNAFNGDARWLDMAMRCPAGSGGYTALTPRQALAPVPYALALPGIQTQQNMTSTNIIGGYKGNYITPGVVGATIGGGGDGTSPNRVTDPYGFVGGGAGNLAGNGNSVITDAVYSTISGGYGNSTRGSYSAIGGGYGNTASGESAVVSGGNSNSATGNGTSVGGGFLNVASDYWATVGGGFTNAAQGDGATVGGGGNNAASGPQATVSGGHWNVASAGWATVPGGSGNIAAGDYSLAAGRRAKANHPGSFVWGDSTDADVTSTGANQFVVRASGGVAMTVGGGAFRLVPTSYTSPNIIGGYSGNSIAITNTEGATIGGGGGNGLPNRIFVGSGTASFATISGGTNNAASGYLSTIGGGANNIANDTSATVNGGYSNAAGVNASVGGGGYNTASGEAATIGGGECNTASGKMATISGGGHNYEVQCNTASAEYATIPGGANTLASIYGQFAYATGGFNNPGDAQTSMFVLRNQSVDATPTDLYLDGTGQRLSLANNRTLTFDVLVVARSNANASAGYQIRGVIENNAGATSLIGTPIVTTLGEDVAAWNVNVVADDTNDALVVQVTGAASTTIRWVATVHTTEVAW